MTSPRYSLKMFMPKRGKIRIPTPLITMTAFTACPSCGASREDVSPLAVKFQCGLMQVLTDGDEFAIMSSCPYAMQAVEELRTRRISRGVPLTLAVMGSQEEFKKGESVRWVSQSAGKETVKKGVIVAVVPPHAKPEDYIPDGMRRNSSSGYGKPRDHITYLIGVAGKGSMVYWPRVHVLQKI